MDTKKIRIGINARILQEPMSGIPRFTLNLVEELAKPEKNCEIHLFLLKRSFTNRDIEKRLYNNPRIVLHISRWSGSSYMSRMLWDLIFLGFEANRQRLDIFFGPAFTVPLVMLYPSIVLIYDVVLKKAPNASRRFISVLFQFLQLYILNPLVIRKAKIVFTCSESSRADLVEYYGISRNRIHVICAGVEQNFQPLKNKNRVDEVLGRLEIKRPYIFYPSGFVPRKNQIMLIEAFAQLNSLNPEGYQLVVFGSGERQYIKQVNQKITYFGLEKNVSILPIVSEEDLIALYNGAILCVYPSLYEGFGIPILEAMACGTPVIASNVSSLPEVVGKAGLLCSPKDPNDLAKTMHLVLTKKYIYNQLVESGFKQIKKFTWENAAYKLVEVFSNHIKSN